MARNKKSTFSFGADEGLEFAPINNIDKQIQNKTADEKNNTVETEISSVIATPSKLKEESETTETTKSIQESASCENTNNNEPSDTIKNSKGENISEIEQKTEIHQSLDETVSDSAETLTKIKNLVNESINNQQKTLAEKISNQTIKAPDDIILTEKKDNLVASEKKPSGNITVLQSCKNTFYNIDPSKPIKEQSLPYKQDNCKPRVATILDEYMRFVRVRSKKLGIPLNLYINIIIDEYRSSIENIDDEERYSSLYNELSRQYKGSKLRTNFFLIPENADFIEEEITNIGCNPSQYFNHIINLEMQREKNQGTRI